MAALRAVDALATDLIARGRVLPAPDEAGDGHGLVWHPVLQGPDLVAADTLAAALPPVCRCERVPGEDPPTAAAVVEAALAAAVDAHARARITGTRGAGVGPGLGARAGRRARAGRDVPARHPRSPACVAGPSSVRRTPARRGRRSGSTRWWSTTSGTPSRIPSPCSG